MSTTVKRVRELEAEIGRLDFGRAPPPCLDEACEYLRAYADSLDRAPHEPGTGRYYVAHGVEVCEKDSDGDDIVLAACGASIAGRSSTYTTLPRKSNMELAQRIVDLLNRAAPPPPDVQAWQPIETAPHMVEVVCWWTEINGAQVDTIENTESARLYGYSHWIPLPYPPQTKLGAP